MKPFVLIPHTFKYENVKDTISLMYCYLHGDLQTQAGFDIFSLLKGSVSQDLIVNDHIILKDGIYPCVYEGRPCTLFYWLDERSKNRGLVVYNDDKLYMRDALECYLSKKEFI